MAMPSGFAAALQEKYAILRLQAQAQAKAADAEAGLNRTRAGLLPAESAANIGLTKAQTGLAGANIRSLDENTKFVAPLANASIFSTRAQGKLFSEQAVGESQLNKLLKPKTGSLFGKGLPSADDQFEERLKSILREGLGY